MSKPVVAQPATPAPTWGELNRERGVLIDQSALHVLTQEQQTRLDKLTRLADAYLAVVAPKDTEALEELEARVGSRNCAMLEEFTAYCRAHPQERFWQALRNWSGYHAILAASLDGATTDTFHWESLPVVVSEPHHCGCPLGGPHTATCPTVLGDIAKEARP